MADLAKKYTPKTFPHLKGLKGISDGILESHFKLYEGYVNRTNKLTETLYGLAKEGQASGANPAYAEMTRRMGFEYNGMVLHEYYFGNLKRGGGGDPPEASAFHKAANESYGSWDVWKADFVGVGKMRGVGWAICYEDPVNGRLSNHWITLHEVGNVSGFTPLLVLDVWEHAFLLDYAPSERPKYIEAFFANVDWGAVEARLRGSPREAARQRVAG
jgi:superoxide dismutase, Fe-Mn family